LAGDTLNAAAVTITGTPITAGDFTLEIRAWNGPNKTGNGPSPTFEYTISVSADSTAPSITTQPTAQSATVGQSVTFIVAASGNPTPTFQWRKDGANISGATSATLTLSSVSLTDAGSYSVVVTNSAGSVTSNAVALTVQSGGGGGPTVTAHPSSVDVAAGSNPSFSVTVTSDTTPTIQWFRHRSGESEPTALTGETSANLSLNNVQAADMGFYFARVSSGGTTVDSDAAILTLTGGSSRLVNLATRGKVPAGGFLTPGFVLQGDGNKELVIRAVGPTLQAFGVATALDDPAMNLIPSGGTDPFLSNDDYGDAANAAELVSKSAAVGAFALADGSKDAAALTTVPVPNTQGSRGYTVQIRSTDGSAGIAIAEVYDAENLTAPVELINVSALGFSGVGEEGLIPGFVINGTGAKTMLIRVVGPRLVDFGVVGTMTDPQLEVIPQGQTFTVAANDNWGGTTELKAAFASTGAFEFTDDNSLDAAVVVRLPPGAYTVRATGANDGTGQILVEAYAVP
jgi:hypothetical protein